MRLRNVLLLLLGAALVHCVRKKGLKHQKKDKLMGHVRRNASLPHFGLWPSVFNLATKALISANATCGEGGRQDFCRPMADGFKIRCGVCDALSSDPGRKHPIENALDGTNRWWQSPPLSYGPDFEFVTITIDLKQVYQIADVIVKMANSPRPATWVLERSLDAIHYHPWQFFARNDKECVEKFGLHATKGKPNYSTDAEVICSTFYSRIKHLEQGEVHTSLMSGRPGAGERSPELLEFTKARYVRLRLMGLLRPEETRHPHLDEFSREKTLFYTLREISIGGMCVCNGHAENCRHNVASGHLECECGHHTCGPSCDKCCPMHNQRQWGAGSSRDARQCLPCNCHGHAASCHYEEDVDKAGLSMDINGNYQGGGVCDNCTAHTSGINCEQCMPGYFRASGTPREAHKPCFRCECAPEGSTGMCLGEGPRAGQCECLPGYEGVKCERCATGFRGWPQCESCPCDARGVLTMEDCEGECLCKANVEGKLCDRCKPGYFGLSSEDPEGCRKCYCSDVSTLCESITITPHKVTTLKDWLLSDLEVTKPEKPTLGKTGPFSSGINDFPDTAYWLAPLSYTGNKLSYYNSQISFQVQATVDRGDFSGSPTNGPNLVLVGHNGLRLTHGYGVFTATNRTFRAAFHIPLQEQQFHHLNQPISRTQFLSVLANIKYVLLRATFHDDQAEFLLEEVTLGSDSGTQVEKCTCPSGYSGLSCESCAFGHVRVHPNISAPGDSFCVKCDCNNHSASCDLDTGECKCLHDTVGENCERCKPSFYGNPLKGNEDDCQKCACPLEEDSNNFSPSCQLDEEDGGYVCTQCPKGYTGDHCEVCDDGHFGNPMEVGNSCKHCDCNGMPCDPITGQCLGCKGNTEGWRCERCKAGFFGEPSTSCLSCQCDPVGALSEGCDPKTGQCDCRERFTGQTCDRCEVGFGNVTALCAPCACNPTGSASDVCDPHSGLCNCRLGVEGFHCDACQDLHYGFSADGCQGEWRV